MPGWIAPNEPSKSVLLVKRELCTGIGTVLALLTSLTRTFLRFNRPVLTEIRVVVGAGDIFEREGSFETDDFVSIFHGIPGQVVGGIVGWN